MNMADFYYHDGNKAAFYCIRHLPNDFLETKRRCSLYNGERICSYEEEQDRFERQAKRLIGAMHSHD